MVAYATAWRARALVVREVARGARRVPLDAIGALSDATSGILLLSLPLSLPLSLLMRLAPPAKLLVGGR